LNEWGCTFTTPYVFMAWLGTGKEHFNVRMKFGEGKVVPVLNKAQLHDGLLEEWRYSSTHSLTSSLDGGQWSASRPSRFTPRERASCTHWIVGWVGPRAGPYTVVKRKIPSSRWESNPRSSNRPTLSHSLYRLSYPGSQDEVWEGGKWMLK
jgi:hypothetical protein